ncbi:MAG: tRNA (adenosine(37)-N6)-threonylcarbamoyltransferase complex ATPase subunit type 1 TsaE [Lentisphaeria bacterium]|nr:tRNA (adenosine(37)-N6)-threonylcarbamoyltransferase complex ATPase subunit type 1 TsaE [Lentisphaeria bacterium]
MKQVYYTNSADETRELAAKIAAETPNGTVFALDGNLGAGKTVFASGFARGLGITEPVSSPTFTIVQEYPRANGMFFHLDLYRIDNPDAALAFGIDEFLYASDAISLVEWPERIDGLFPPGTIRVAIERTDREETRKITIEKPD